MDQRGAAVVTSREPEHVKSLRNQNGLLKTVVLVMAALTGLFALIDVPAALGIARRARVDSVERKLDIVDANLRQLMKVMGVVPEDE